jgi:hypothetical protein
MIHYQVFNHPPQIVTYKLSIARPTLLVLIYLGDFHPYHHLRGAFNPYHQASQWNSLTRASSIDEKYTSNAIDENILFI